MISLPSLTTVSDLSREINAEILSRAVQYKEKLSLGIHQEPCLNGAVVAMIFEKPSLRTRVAFEVATTYLGGTPIVLSSSQIFASGNNESGRESIPDIAHNLERFAQLIVARVYRHSVIQELRGSLSRPLINALCDAHHPTQALADLMTIRILKGSSAKLKVAYIGDGNNVATSLMQICAMEGISFSIASPPGYELPEAERSVAAALAKRSEAKLDFLREPAQAAKNADVIYTDTFVSMGQESDREKRSQDFAEYQVTDALLKLAKEDCIFMHCLPAHRGEEVTDQVMDSKQSVVFEQAENRLHIAKALLSIMLKQ